MKDGAWFPYMLVALLLISVGANIYLVVRATNDPSFAVEPDYYAKAVEWDAIQAARAESEALGWTVDLEPSVEGAVVRLRDGAGLPIEGAKVGIVAFHNARAAERYEAQMKEEGDGHYAFDANFAREGLWEFQIEARWGEDTFTHVAREVIQ